MPKGNGGGGTGLTVKGTRGDDTNLVLPEGALITQVTIDGGAGTDTLNLSDYGSGVTITLEGGYAKSKSSVADQAFTGLFGNYMLPTDGRVTGTIRNVENVIGTQYNDYLHLNILNTPKFADGGAGNDVLNSHGGNDTLVGGTGCDWLVGYWQNVTLIGGTWDGVTATPDGQTDYFYVASSPFDELTAPDAGDFEIRYVLEAPGGRLVIAKRAISVR